MAKRFLCYNTDNPVGVTEDGVLDPNAIGGSGGTWFNFGDGFSTSIYGYQTAPVASSQLARGKNGTKENDAVSSVIEIVEAFEKGPVYFNNAYEQGGAGSWTCHSSAQVIACSKYSDDMPIYAFVIAFIQDGGTAILKQLCLKD